MKLVQLLLALGASSAVSGAVLKVEVCSDGVNDFGVKEIHLGGMVVGGEELSLDFTQVPNRYVGKGHVRVELAVENVRVHSEVFDLCKVSNCHVHPFRESSSRVVMKVPKHLPTGLEVEVRVIVNDHNGKLLSCVSAQGQGVRVHHGEEVLLEEEEQQAKNIRGSAEPEFSLPYSQLKFMFDKWLEEYGMKFTESEMVERMMIFGANLKRIVTHNRLSNSTYKMGMNQFGALTSEEFGQSYFGLKMPKRGAIEIEGVKREWFVPTIRDLSDLPEEIDWVSKGAVTGVKNQGACGSCWAFSTTGGLEGAYFLKTGKLVSFSEQQLVSCDHVDQGCSGGFMDNADKWIRQNGGLCTEEDFPYASGSGQAKACSKCTVVEGTSPSSIVDVDHTKAALEEAVAKQPVSIAIEADQMAFQFYKKGVLTGTCGAMLDHGVLAVGYGTLDGVKFWKVKNSWGDVWGLNGYVLIERGKPVKGGECGLLQAASYPML